MVYNALKLFMEINPDLFDEAMQQYKQRRVEYVVTSISSSFLQLSLGIKNTPSNNTRTGRN